MLIDRTLGITFKRTTDIYSTQSPLVSINCITPHVIRLRLRLDEKRSTCKLCENWREGWQFRWDVMRVLRSLRKMGYRPHAQLLDFGLQ